MSVTVCRIHSDIFQVTFKLPGSAGTQAQAFCHAGRHSRGGCSAAESSARAHTKQKQRGIRHRQAEAVPSATPHQTTSPRKGELGKATGVVSEDLLGH